jgi:hypothetical protein
LRQSTSAIPLVGIVGLGLFYLDGIGLDGIGGLDGSRGGFEPAVMHAASSQAYDYDQDGLSNHFESTMGTSPYTVDTDGDGYCDLEEFARGSNPLESLNVPLPGGISLNMSASGEVDGVHLQIATYFTDGDLRNKDIQAGIVINGEPRLLPGLLKEVGVDISQWNAAGGGTIVLLNAPFPESVVHTFGQVSLFTMMSVESAPGIVAASAMNLASVDGVVGLVQSDPQVRWGAFSYQGAMGGGSSGSSVGPGAGSIYTPIPTGDGTVPATWNPGEICFQATIPISNTGGVITSEVVAADCISGNGSCPPGCSTSVGDVLHSFDPLGLIGG